MIAKSAWHSDMLTHLSISRLLTCGEIIFGSSSSWKLHAFDVQLFFIRLRQEYEIIPPRNQEFDKCICGGGEESKLDRNSKVPWNDETITPWHHGTIVP